MMKLPFAALGALLIFSPAIAAAPDGTPDGSAAAQVVRMFAVLAVQAPGCGLRSDAWGKAVLKRLEADIPARRADLRADADEGARFAHEQLASGRDMYCHDLGMQGREERYGDELLEGRRSIWRTTDPTAN